MKKALIRTAIAVGLVNVLIWGYKLYEKLDLWAGHRRERQIERTAREEFKRDYLAKQSQRMGTGS